MRRWNPVYDKYRRPPVGLALLAALLLSGCIAARPYPSPRAPRNDAYYGNPRRGDSSESWDAERLRNILIPLVRAMDHPCLMEELRVGVVRQTEINAASTGGCQFYVTTALLRQASADQLRGVMAHEIAHEDLGHVAKAQVLSAGIDAGVALLEQLLPGSSAITPLAGALIARTYGRSEEYAADLHAVEILRRAGYRKEIMIDTLSWLRRTASDLGGGFLSTHPALDDRIDALRRSG
jgi:predicted Zn-dependent protease